MIVLIGPPGSGKSVVGEMLARRLGVPFADTDALIEQAAGKPIGDVFVEDGEEAFRELEGAAVRRALIGQPGVLALGSGAVLDPEIRQLVTEFTVVYLRTGFATIAKRSGMDRPRVVLPGNPRGMLRTMLAQREPVYESLATVTVSSDELSPEEIVEQLS
jgi:shikimate kinase